MLGKTGGWQELQTKIRVDNHKTFLKTILWTQG